MSERRRARSTTAPRGDSGIPAELTDPRHPIWHDEVALLARFSDVVDDQVISRLRMGGRVYQQVVSRWCLVNGYESDVWKGAPDWRAFRSAAGRA